MNNVEPLIPKKPGPKPGRAAMLREENESLRKRVLELENQIAGFKTAAGVVPAPVSALPAPVAVEGLEHVATEIFVRRVASMQLEAFPASVLTDNAETEALTEMWARVREIAVHAASVFLEDPAGSTTPDDE